jgi:hypothetical protein
MTKSVNSLNNQTFDSSFFVQNDDVSALTSNLDMQKSRAGGVITSGDAIGNLRYLGFDGAAYTVGAQILGVTGGTIGAGRMPTDLLFATAPDSVTSATLRLTIGRAGNITVAAPDSGVALTITAGGETITAGDLTLSSGNINLPTTASASVGVINVNATRFIHSFGGTNTFVGGGNGNFTLTSFSCTGVGANVLSALTSGAFNTAGGFVSQGAVTTGGNNASWGAGSFTTLTTGSSNSAFGNSALNFLLSGSNNSALGLAAGTNYTGAESNNIVIGHPGVLGESNAIYLGLSGTQTKTVIAGISGVAVSNLALVSINTTTGQLGSTTGGSSFLNALNGDSGTATPTSGAITIAGGTGISTSAAGSTVTINATGTTVLTYTNVNTTPYVVLVTDEYLSVDSSGAPITVQLPNAATSGRVWIIKDRTGSAGTNSITVTTVGGAVNIDGATTFVMNTNRQAINVIGNGSTYEVF